MLALPYDSLASGAAVTLLAQGAVLLYLKLARDAPDLALQPSPLQDDVPMCGEQPRAELPPVDWPSKIARYEASLRATGGPPYVQQVQAASSALQGALSSLILPS